MSSSKSCKCKLYWFIN